ncbi:MAG: phosphoribosylaminoimidazolesuccinocarboxamide synthase [Defluviitaleaceae bacterium]|nr:phosphoribosylaminoimidazolesuccinocarboxamide synthase [Defluviitaleaceae bacterium]
MKLIYQGKTKDVYENPNGTYTLKLKDSATGKDGVFDPGENTVGLSIEGLGRESLRMSKYFFEKLTQAGIPNHYIESDIQAATMTVQAGKPFGINGIEFICRRRADGSFLRRYGTYTSFGANLDCFVEVTLKDDEKKDPPITKDALAALNIMTPEEYETCKSLTQKVTKLVADDLAQKGLELYDIKYEYFKSGDGIILADEFSAGVMRVYKSGKPVQPMELARLIFGD